MEIGHRIKKARELAGLSQTDLADLTRRSRGLVGQWESHKKKPGRESLIKVASATSVSVGFLLGQEEIGATPLTTQSPEEAALLRQFRRLNGVQRKNLLHLVGISVDIRQEIEQQRNPSKAESVS